MLVCARVCACVCVYVRMCACIPGPSPFQLHFSSLSKHYFSNLNPFLIRETITLSSDESGTDYLFR